MLLYYPIIWRNIILCYCIMLYNVICYKFILCYFKIYSITIYFVVSLINNNDFNKNILLDRQISTENYKIFYDIISHDFEINAKITI